jgi:hypothetical protein
MIGNTLQTDWRWYAELGREGVLFRQCSFFVRPLNSGRDTFVMWQRAGPPRVPGTGS